MTDAGLAFSLSCCSGVAREWEAAGRVWHEASYRLPAHWTSGAYLASIVHSGKCVQINIAYRDQYKPCSSGCALLPVSAGGWVDGHLLSALIQPFLLTPQGLPDYTKWLTHYSTKKQSNPAIPITCRSYARYCHPPGRVRITKPRAASCLASGEFKARSCVLTHRVGLMGNPSDGFNGKTIAMSISNFWAEVTLVESQTLVTRTFSNQNHFFPLCCSNLVYLALFQVLLPHPLNDPTEFGSLQDLFCISRKEGCVHGELERMKKTAWFWFSQCCLYRPLQVPGRPAAAASHL